VTDTTVNPPRPAVIVGAGPCGLAAACALMRLGVPVRVLESATERGRGARSSQLWPPALEVLDRIGVLAEARRRGVRIKANEYHIAGGRRIRIELGAENEPLILPQEQTTELLEDALERLGGRVERATEVISVDAGLDVVIVKARGPDGPKLIEADWLIGADGVHSLVREQLGIDFEGEPVPMIMLVSEGRVTGRYDRGCVHSFLGRTGSLMFVPMPGDIVRVAGAVPRDTPLTRDAVQKIVDDRGPGGLLLAEPELITTFGSQERVAAEFRRGRCFLVGDAAHTHAPVGGQGLNLGLQDVHNLAWKLAGVIHGRLRPEILDTYDTERRQAAEQIIRTTHQLVWILTRGPIAAWVRNTAAEALQAAGVLRRRFIPRLAGWRISYPDILLGSQPAGAPRSLQRPVSRALPRPGVRTPHWVPVPEPGTGDLFRLLTIGTPADGLAHWGEAIAGRLPDLLSHDHLPRRGTGFLLLRPDGYVAARGKSADDLDRLERTLADHLISGGTDTLTRCGKSGESDPCCSPSRR